MVEDVKQRQSVEGKEHEIVCRYTVLDKRLSMEEIKNERKPMKPFVEEIHRRRKAEKNVYLSSAAPRGYCHLHVRSALNEFKYNCYAQVVEE
jgi:hypothetical protein